MAAGTAYSAKNAKVRIGTTVYYAQVWEVDPESTYDDTSNFEGAGFENQVACLRKCTFTVDGWWDGGANPFDFATDIKIQDGQTLASVKLYVSDTTGPFWSFPSAHVLAVKMVANVAQKLTLNMRCKAAGTFTYPTGNVA